MLQKRKTTVWMLFASLIVMSIFISCFATSATRTYARLIAPPPPHLEQQIPPLVPRLEQRIPHLLDLYVLRSFNSQVGAVQAEDTTNQGLTVKCQNVPNQNVPTFVKAFGLNDNVIITLHAGGRCEDAGRVVHQNVSLRDLQGCSNAIKHTNACRALQLDFQA